MGRELSRERFQEIGWLGRRHEASEDVGLSRNFTHTDLLRGLRGPRFLMLMILFISNQLYSQVQCHFDNT